MRASLMVGLLMALVVAPAGVVAWLGRARRR